MIIKHIGAIILLCLTILTSTNVRAGFIATDWLVEGDSLSVLHEETGVEWLKLTETAGKTFPIIISDLENGKYDGWRLPTLDEVDIMWNSFFDETPQGSQLYWNDDTVLKAREFGELFGYVKSGYNFSIGRYLIDLDADISGMHFVVYNNTNNDGYMAVSDRDKATSGQSIYGIYLVKDGVGSENEPTTPVDAPTTLGIFSILLIAFSTVRRKRENT